MPDRISDLVSKMEEARKAGTSLSGAHFKLYSQSEQKEALRRQSDIMEKEGIIKRGKKADKRAAGDDIMEMQSKFRQGVMNKKGYQ